MPTEKKEYYQRKQFYISKQFQSRFIMKFCLLVVVGAVISTALLLFFSQNTLTSSFQNSRLTIQNTAQTIMPSVIYTNLISLVLISVAAIFITLFISHKIAGPLYRLEQSLKQLEEGDLTQKVHLRKYDQITGVAETLSQTINGLHAKISDIDNDLVMLKNEMKKNKVPDHIHTKLDDLNRKLHNHFKV